MIKGKILRNRCHREQGEMQRMIITVLEAERELYWSNIVVTSNMADGSHAFGIPRVIKTMMM